MCSHAHYETPCLVTYTTPSPTVLCCPCALQAFMANIGPTLLLAFVGTVLSASIVGVLVWLAGQLGLCYPLGLLASLTFGSVISATDPVTVLTVFQVLGVDVNLFSIIFGESVLNDAVAIVLSRMLLGFNQPAASVDAASISAALLFFFVDFLGSMAIGLIFGVVASLLTKWLDLRNSGSEDTPYLAVALCGLIPWASYYTAEALQLSGIVTILFCGMLMAQYTRANLGSDASELASRTFRCVAVVAETFVFIYLGEALFSYPILHSTVWRLVLVALVACGLGRLHVWPAAWMNNRCSRGAKITPGGTVVLWWSGLRGGVAFALAASGFSRLDFPHHCGGLRQERRSSECETEVDGVPGMSDSLAIMQTTLLLAAFTIFFFGGSISDVAIRCDVLQPTVVPVHRSASWSNGGSDLLSRIDQRLIRPWLTVAGDASAIVLSLVDSQTSSPTEMSAGKELTFPVEPLPTPLASPRNAPRRALLRRLLAVAAILPVALWLLLNRELAAACADAPSHSRLLWTVPGTLQPKAAWQHSSTVLFGELQRDSGGGGSSATEFARHMGMPQPPLVDCTASGAGGSRSLGGGAGRGRGQLWAQLRQCGRRGLRIDNSTLVLVSIGLDELAAGHPASPSPLRPLANRSPQLPQLNVRPLQQCSRHKFAAAAAALLLLQFWRGGVLLCDAIATTAAGEPSGRNGTLFHVLHGLLTRRRSRVIDSSLERLLNFTRSTCELHGCPHAFILIPPTLPTREVPAAKLSDSHTTTTQSRSHPPHH